jgi:hypothetical protein
MMMSEVIADPDPELTRLVDVIVSYTSVPASVYLDLEALELRFRTARTPRFSRRHVVDCARCSRFMHVDV